MARRILDRLQCRPDDCWLEIGPGHGEMTLALAAASRALVAVERDPRLAEELRIRLEPFPRARVVEADILEASAEELARQLETRRLRVYGNLPYYITSPILRRLFEGMSVIQDIHVMVQLEVAQRMTAVPGGRKYGYLSVLTQFHATAELLLHLPRGAFQPPPKVESALVRLVPPGASAQLDVGDTGGFLAFLSACFRQKRKTLRNNLRSRYRVISVEAALAALDLKASVRAEELPLEELARVYARLAQV